MRSMLIVGVGLLLATSGAFAQMTGSVSGVVYDADSNSVANAVVHLSAEGWHGGHGGHGHGHGDNYFDQTEDDGSFLIDEVTPGEYYIIASLMGYGHDMEEIVIVANENTVIDLVLDMGNHDGGHHGDSLIIIEIAGYAIVEVDSFHTHYYLDTEGDDEVDYHLSFGPPWYDPDSGAERPADGDSIWIVGGLMGYSQPQMVVVYEINGLFWREPGMGHGGHGGNGGDCPNPDSVELAEVSGTAIVDEMPHMSMYFLDENSDNLADYHLNFGAPWYDPGNGAARPADGDNIDIVGGLMEGCGDLPVIIVYEINGQFWREPGDTVGLWFSPTAVEDNLPAVPNNPIIAGNYPNPFNPSTTIFFELPSAQNIKITVFDLLGRELVVLANQVFQSGANEILFNSEEHNLKGSSVYFYKIEGGSTSVTGKMVLLK